MERSLFCLESKDGIDIKVSHGLFSENNKLIYIPPKPNNDNNYKGWPILSSNNYKVIGIHCGNSQSPEYAEGSFIRFINKSQNFENNIEIKKIKKIKNNEINNEITIKYIILEDDKIKIFNKDFVLKNKENFKIIVEGKEQEICSELDITENIKNKEFLEIKLKQYNLVYDISNMFAECKQLISISDLSNLNTIEVTHMENLFYDCSELESISDISKWKTSNVINMRGIFYN